MEASPCILVLCGFAKVVAEHCRGTLSRNVVAQHFITRAPSRARTRIARDGADVVVLRSAFVAVREASLAAREGVAIAAAVLGGFAQ